MRTLWFIGGLGLLVWSNIHAERVTVYLMDNGVRVDHQAFEGIETESVDIIGEGKRKSGEKTDIYGDHGTLLAGLVVARVPRVRLVSVRTLDNAGEGKWSDFVRGVHWITNHHQQGAAAVANLSLGGSPKDPRIQKLVTEAIDRLVESGVTVVVAAGNDGKDVPGRIPSTLDSVISVGAVSLFNNRLDSSNFGSCVDIYARGENLEGPGSMGKSDQYRESGTSVAAAVVTGLIAGFLEEHPDASPEEARAWLLKRSLTGKVGNFPGPDNAELEAESLLIEVGS
jgi:subtilisin family serine protease